MKLDLSGKIFVIIGGTTGIGWSAAQAFVEAGAQVVVVGRNSQSVHKAAEDLGKNGIALSGDAADPATAEMAIQTARRELGGFHGLYHVAGGSGRSQGDGPMHLATDEGWQYTIQQNLTSVFNSNRAAIQAFLEMERGGVILNMSSVLGFSPSPVFFSSHAYAAAKAAIIGLTRSAAAAYACVNIRLNVIAPGLVETPMSERAQENEEIMNFVKSKQPLDGGRIGVPEDLDAAAVFLMSEESKFITGQTLAVDGGWSVTEGQWKDEENGK
ncbi:MAG: NAD(P)-dependent dehydrogenase (short-subunit alcohol dehydrogenase family) [Candidatus Binatia bacterium]|jgi:NAD(P)-dependent dehydrogenase (short-subunit alcohol dehydrogenase family)